MQADAVAPLCSMAWSDLSTDTAQCTKVSTMLVFACLMLAGIRRRSAKPDAAVHAPLLSGDARSFWLDNCRFWLVTLVIVGHIIALPWTFGWVDGYWLKPVLSWANTIHIPGLAFISGVCSHGPLTSPRAARLIVFLLIPYMFSRLFNWAYSCHIGASCLLNPFRGDGIEWYLLSLLQWRLAICLCAPVRGEVLLIASFVCALTSGYYIPFDGVLAIERTMAFFPFFVAGFLFDLDAARHHVERNPILRTVAFTVLSVTLAVLWFGPPSWTIILETGMPGDFNFDYANPRIDPEHPWKYLGMPRCGLEFWLSPVWRVPRYVLSFVMLAATLILVPSRETWYTEAGRYTMYPYLLHGWLIFAMITWAQHHPYFLYWTMGPFWKGGWTWLVAIGAGFIFSLATTTHAVRRVFGFVIEPVWAYSFMLEDEDAESKMRSMKQRMRTTKKADKSTDAV